MLAQTSLRHLTLTTQLVIGVVLLSASYLTHDHASVMADDQMKVNHQLQPAIEKSTEKVERC